MRLAVVAGAVLVVVVVAAPPAGAEIPRTIQGIREWYERNVSPEEKSEIRARFAAREAICGRSEDNITNPSWMPCVNAVDDMYRRSQPPKPESKPQPAATSAAKPGQQRVWVNGVVIPTCSHGGLCHGRLMEALQRPVQW
jgi:hypothetical protein